MIPGHAAILDPLSAILKSALSGEPAPWPRDVSPHVFIEWARSERVLLLLRECAGWRHWPADVRDTWQEETRQEAWMAAAGAMITEADVTRVLRHFTQAGIPVLILKGTALAYTHYSQPHLRPRADTDLLIRKEDSGRAAGVLESIGFHREMNVSGDWVSGQAPFSGSHGTQIDLHWQITNVHVFAGALPFEELWQNSIPLPALGPSARTLSAPYALLLACIHRIAHHHGGQFLIWLYDIHLLASRMNAEETGEFVRLAKAKKAVALCRDGLESAHEWFGTPIPEPLQPDSPEPSAALLQPNLRRLDVLRLDLQSLPLRARIGLLKEHLFPPASYMLASYSTNRRYLLPALYLHRALSGLPKWFK